MGRPVSEPKSQGGMEAGDDWWPRMEGKGHQSRQRGSRVPGPDFISLRNGRPQTSAGTRPCPKGESSPEAPAGEAGEGVQVP